MCNNDEDSNSNNNIHFARKTNNLYYDKHNYDGTSLYNKNTLLHYKNYNYIQYLTIDIMGDKYMNNDNN